jgi:O-antigen ligase
MTYFPNLAMVTHNNYLDILSQVGLVGTFFFGWFLMAMFRVAWQASRRVRGASERGFAAAALGGCVGVLISMGLADWFIPFAYTQTIAGYSYTVYSWILLGAVLALVRITEHGSDDTEAVSPGAAY